jgi:hypothetical protein
MAGTFRRIVNPDDIVHGVATRKSPAAPNEIWMGAVATAHQAGRRWPGRVRARNAVQNARFERAGF